MFFRILLVLTVILSTVPPIFAADVDNIALATIEFTKDKKAYDSKKFKDAQTIMTKAAALGSRDPIIQY
ncbi:MAG: hypothetical protein SGJ27_18900 [Candidatus Melainabacteria bacterium]|nr:hypothetical protein [Candidatus Melainabacteria bacterium]